MRKAEAKGRIIDYLRRYNIPHSLINASERPFIPASDLAIYIRFRAESAPDGFTECTVRFCEDVMEARAYYSGNAASWVAQHMENLPGVLQVVNFVNARVFLGDLLYTPRLYVTANEEPEFAVSTVIPYRFFKADDLGTLEYITCYYPEFLGLLSFPLFLTLLGRITPEEAVRYISTEMLGEESSLMKRGAW